MIVKSEWVRILLNLIKNQDFFVGIVAEQLCMRINLVVTRYRFWYKRSGMVWKILRMRTNLKKDQILEYLEIFVLLYDLYF